MKINEHEKYSIGRFTSLRSFVDSHLQLSMFEFQILFHRRKLKDLCTATDDEHRPWTCSLIDLSGRDFGHFGVHPTDGARIARNP